MKYNQYNGITTVYHTNISSKKFSKNVDIIMEVEYNIIRRKVEILIQDERLNR